MGLAPVRVRDVAVDAKFPGFRVSLDVFGQFIGDSQRYLSHAFMLALVKPAIYSRDGFRKNEGLEKSLDFFRRKGWL